MQLPYSDELNIEYLGQLFANTSECYKFFWFKAILDKVSEGKTELSYDELVNEMIADAWYMVTEYHLNLGPRDTLECLVNLIKEKNPKLKSCEKREAILKFLKETEDRDILDKKKTLTYNVPYRLQAPFMQKLKGKEWNVGVNSLIEKINQEDRVMYYFTALNGMSTKILIREDWARYIIRNQEIIRGWLEYNLILYLQRRNPSVPGIADKIKPPATEMLNDIRKYWRVIISLEPIYEIYDNKLMTEEDVSIDHFVPWSYVAHDEMWNLSPTKRKINSAKSNNLPDWDTYFDKFARLEYQSYQLMWKSEAVHKEFEKCAVKHINNDEVRCKMYRRGQTFEQFKGEIGAMILPIYQSAANCGFGGDWIYNRI